MAAFCGPEGERILLPEPCAGCTTPNGCEARAVAHNQYHAYFNPKLPTPGIPDDAKARKTGVIDYFPDALAAVAHLSFMGNEQHNPGTPLHWDRSKSGDESDALMRHFIQRGTLDKDGIRHSAKVAWRALALLQKEIERESGPKPGEWKKV